MYASNIRIYIYIYTHQRRIFHKGQAYQQSCMRVGNGAGCQNYEFLRPAYMVPDYCFAPGVPILLCLPETFIIAFCIIIIVNGTEHDSYWQTLCDRHLVTSSNSYCHVIKANSFFTPHTPYLSLEPTANSM